MSISGALFILLVSCHALGTTVQLLDFHTGGHMARDIN